MGFDRKYKLTTRHTYDYFFNILGGSAPKFLLNKEIEGMKIADMAAMTMKDYNSDSVQKKIKGKLDKFRINSFMGERKIK